MKIQSRSVKSLHINHIFENKIVKKQFNSRISIQSDNFMNKSASVQNSFGPLVNPFNDITKINPKAEVMTIIKNILKEEKEINSWVIKLKKGYVPSIGESIDIQRLIYSNTQKIEIFTKVLESVNNSIKTLERMQF